MITARLIISNLKYLNGFLPVNKPKGICLARLLRALRLDLQYELGRHGISGGHFVVDSARYLDPFANGLVTFIYGNGNFKRRNFIHADYKYKIKIEFGVDREYFSIDGQVLNRLNVEHLTNESIEAVLPLVTGTIEQKFISAYTLEKPDIVDHESMLNETKSVYTLMPLGYKREKKSQKYSFTRPPKSTICHKVKLLEFNNPFATLEVHCKGSLNMRQLAVDIAEKLNTKASLIELVRLEEGPMTLDDPRVIQLHELTLEQYLPRIPLFIDSYKFYLSQYDELFKTESTYRPTM